MRTKLEWARSPIRGFREERRGDGAGTSQLLNRAKQSLLKFPFVSGLPSSQLGGVHHKRHFSDCQSDLTIRGNFVFFFDG